MTDSELIELLLNEETKIVEAVAALNVAPEDQRVRALDAVAGKRHAQFLLTLERRFRP